MLILVTHDVWDSMEKETRHAPDQVASKFAILAVWLEIFKDAEDVMTDMGGVAWCCVIGYFSSRWMADGRV